MMGNDEQSMSMAEYEEAWGIRVDNVLEAVTKPVPTKTIWATKDGRRIRVRQMDDCHLVNTVNYLLRTEFVMRWQGIMDAKALLATVHGEQALFALEREIDCMVGMDPEDWLSCYLITWDVLVTEIYRRDFDKRITWSHTEEYAIMTRDGRTPVGCTEGLRRDYINGKPIGG